MIDDRQLDVEMPWGGKIQLHDGRTGEAFEQKTTVGYIYMMKLHHLVDDKIHARGHRPLLPDHPASPSAARPAPADSSFPARWKSGASKPTARPTSCMELLTVKSDDVEGRTKILRVDGTRAPTRSKPAHPSAFDVLCNEIRGLGLNIQLEKKKRTGRAEPEDADMM